MHQLQTDSRFSACRALHSSSCERASKTHLTEARAAPLRSVKSPLQSLVKTLLQLPARGTTSAALPPHGRQLPVPGCMLWQHHAWQHPEKSWLRLLLQPAAAAGPAGQWRPRLWLQGWWAGPALREPVTSSIMLQTHPLTQQANAEWQQRKPVKIAEQWLWNGLVQVRQTPRPQLMPLT